MKILRPGDMVLHKGKVRRVLRLDSMVQTAFTEDPMGDMLEIENPNPDVVVLGNPAATWRVLNTPTRIGAGPFVELRVPGARPRILVPWADWLQSDAMREGGPVFIRPTLRLLPHTSLLFTHKSGKTVSYTVPANFSTTKHKRKLKAQAQAEDAEKPREPDRFDIMDGDWQK